LKEVAAAVATRQLKHTDLSARILVLNKGLEICEFRLPWRVFAARETPKKIVEDHQWGKVTEVPVGK
jgi:hypothetical protein